MKKVSKFWSNQLLFSLMLFVCALLSSQGLSAQTWYSEQQAIATLNTELSVLNPQLSGLNPGTQDHTNLLRRVTYYKATLTNIQAGISVPDAVENSLMEAAMVGNTSSETRDPEVEKALWFLRNDMIDLLSD